MYESTGTTLFPYGLYIVSLIWRQHITQNKVYPDMTGLFVKFNCKKSLALFNIGIPISFTCTYKSLCILNRLENISMKQNIHRQNKWLHLMTKSSHSNASCCRTMKPGQCNLFFILGM